MNVFIFLLILTSQAECVPEKLELGLGTSSSLQYSFSSTTYTQNIAADVSLAVSNSKSYQIGFYGFWNVISATSSGFRVMATASIHFTDTEWKNAFYLRPMLGWGRDTISTVGYSGLVYGIQFGKRFQIKDNLIYRPSIDFVRDAANLPQMQITLIGLSVFISGPDFF